MRVVLICTMCGAEYEGDARLDGTPCLDERCEGELQNVDDSELLLSEDIEATL